MNRIEIETIQVNRHPSLWTSYQAKKKIISDDLKNHQVENPLKDVSWRRGTSIGDLPILNAEIGECWLFHSTKPEYVPSILQTGFATKYAVRKVGSSWSALDKGIYCSDDFAKVATYVVCRHCDDNHCQCKPEKRKEYKDKKDWKVIFISRVLLGHVRSRRYKEESVEGDYHSSWGPSDVKHTKSHITCNEFIVNDEAQIYPEFCVFYVDNPDQTLDREITLIKKLLLKPFIFGVEGIALKRVLYDYERLSQHAPYWQQVAVYNALRKKVRQLEKGSLTLKQRQVLQGLINFIHSKAELFHQLKTIQNKVTKPAQVYWVLDYYANALTATNEERQELWRQIPYLLNSVSLVGLSEDKLANLMLIRGTAYYHLKQDAEMLRDINQAWFIDAIQTETYFKKPQHEEFSSHYYGIGIGTLYVSVHSSIEDTDPIQIAFYQRIATWKIRGFKESKDWHEFIEEWCATYNELSGTCAQKIFRETLQTEFAVVDANDDKGKKIKAFSEHLCDEVGERLSVQKKRKDFHADLKHYLLKDGHSKSLIKIRWLSRQSTGEYTIKKGPLNPYFINVLFEDPSKLSWRQGQKQGNSFVHCLYNREGRAIAYIKLCPQYPLRQYAMDSLYARFSGYSGETTLGYIYLRQSKGVGHLVLFSMPLGLTEKAKGKEVTLLYLQMAELDRLYEAKSDLEAFSWKFFETLITRPKDNKNDNMVPVPLWYDPDRYTWVSIDNDDALVHHAADKEKVYVHAVNLLMSLMDTRVHSQAIRDFLQRDWDKLFEAWLADIGQYTQLLILKEEKKGLLSQEAFDRFANQGSSYQMACSPQSLFRNYDLLTMYQQVQRLCWELEKNRSVNHWTLLKEMIPELEHHYFNVYSTLKCNTASECFECLPGIDVTFIKKKVPITCSVSPRVKPIPVLLSMIAQEMDSIESYAQLESQMKGLRDSISDYTLVNQLRDALHYQQNLSILLNKDYPNKLREQVLNQLNWEMIPKGFVKQIIETVFCQETVFYTLRIQDCKIPTKALLESLLRASEKSLRVLVLREVNLKEENLRSILQSCILL